MEHLNVPVELIQWAFRNRKVRPLQLYLYLKFFCSGITKLSEKDLQDIGLAIGLKSTRAIKNNLRILKALNWVGHDPKTGWWFIRSFEQVRKDLYLETRSAVVLFRKDINNFRAFAVGATISQLVKRQMRALYCSSEQKKRCSLQKNETRMMPVSNAWTAKVLNISMSTISRCKQKAISAGFILREKNLILIPVLIPVNMNSISGFRKANPEISNRLTVYNNEVFYQGPDLFQTNIPFKIRKKITGKK